MVWGNDGLMMSVATAMAPVPMKAVPMKAVPMKASVAAAVESESEKGTGINRICRSCVVRVRRSGVIPVRRLDDAP
jgi:hypothetical protein